jgi:hypothetical protein
MVSIFHGLASGEWLQFLYSLSWSSIFVAGVWFSSCFFWLLGSWFHRRPDLACFSFPLPVLPRSDFLGLFFLPASAARTAPSRACISFWFLVLLLIFLWFPRWACAKVWSWFFCAHDTTRFHLLLDTFLARWFFLGTLFSTPAARDFFFAFNFLSSVLPAPLAPTRFCVAACLLRSSFGLCSAYQGNALAFDFGT